MNVKAVIYIIAVLALLSVGFAAGYKWNEASYIKLQRDFEIKEKKLIADRLKSAQIAAEHYNGRVKAVEQERDRYMKQVQDKLYENARLNAYVDAARKRLRILVLGQKSCSIQSSTDAGRTEPVAAELDAVARQAYFDLRAGIIKQEALLGFCIEHVRNMSED